MKICGIFAVSIVAIAVAAPAFADIASKAYVDDVVATKESTANKVGTVPSDWNKYTYGGSEEQAGQALYPSVYATQQMISGTMGNKVNTTEGTQQNTLMVRNNMGRATKGTSSDISVTTTNGTTNVTVTHATKADQDGSGNNIVDTYATKSSIQGLDLAADANSQGSGNAIVSVSQSDGQLAATKGNVLDKVGTATGGGNVVTAISENSDGQTIDVVMGITAIPVPDDTATTTGTLVLTATRTEKQGGGYEYTYHWEDLGR